MPIPITTIDNMSPGISIFCPISFRVPSVLTNAKRTGRSATRVNFQSRKKKSRRTITLKPTMNNIFIKVEKRSSPILLEKKPGSNILPVDLYFL